MQVKEETEKEEMEKEEEGKTGEMEGNNVQLPISTAEQQVLQQIQSIKEQPIPIPEKLRENLVNLQAILEKNGRNPELLEEVKKDIEFFDREVASRVVHSCVC